MTTVPPPTRHASDVFVRDAGSVWHPYAASGKGVQGVVHGAGGVRLDIERPDGRRVHALDAMASWWSAIHGYRHPALDAAASAQLGDFSHVMFGGLTHSPAVELCERLVGLTPEPLTRVFLADSGSVSVEVALKAAVQAAQGRGRPASTFLALRGAYHGDTTDAMSVSDPVSGLHHQFAGFLPQQVFAPLPPAAAITVGVYDVHADVAGLDAWAADVQDLAHRHRNDLAGVVCEPIVQGVGGMRAYPAEALRVLRRLADDLGVPLIVDEIATGFGRTGTLFACEHAGVVPDIMCVGKAMTGGYVTGAAMITTEQIAADVEASDAGVLMHGPTFMGNPLMCAIANASIGLLTGTPTPNAADASPCWRTNVARLQRGLAAGLLPALELDAVRQVRTIGAIGVIETHRPVDLPAITSAALDRGVWVRPFRNLVYTLPPYVMDDADLAALTAGLVGAVEEVM